MISFIYFDVGDTLLHKPGVIPQIDGVLKKHNIERSPKVIRKAHFGLREQLTAPPATNLEFYRYFNTELLIRLNIPPRDEIVLSIYEACRELPWIVSDGINTLNDIECQIGILSNWDTSLRTKLSDLVPVQFDNIVVSGELGVSKPDPVIFKKALSIANCKAPEVAIVGDSPRLDINPATSLGWSAILYDPHDLSPSHSGLRITKLSHLAKLLSNVA